MTGEMTLSTDMLKSFCSEGEVTVWLSKSKLRARLREITDIGCVISLYLKCDALALYIEMTVKEQRDADVIQLRLKETFTYGPFVSYTKLASVV